MVTGKGPGVGHSDALVLSKAWARWVCTVVTAMPRGWLPNPPPIGQPSASWPH